MQNESSLWTRGPETNGIFAACEELAIGLVAYRPLGKGFLAGAMSKDTRIGEGGFRKILPRFTPDAMEKNQALIDLLKRIASEKNAGADRAGVASRAEALDCTDSRHHQAVPLRGEHRCRRPRADRSRSLFGGINYRAGWFGRTA